MTLGIYIPTYGRAYKLKEVAKNIKQATRTPYKLYWGIEIFDKDSVKEASQTNSKIVFNNGNPCYSDALQAIYESSDEEIFFWANDDFRFLDGWDIAPMEMMKDENISVLGVHDGNPHTKFSTISFIRRKYIEEQSGVIDMPNRVLYPYKHNYVDDELTETAKKRGVWAYCAEPCIHHQHHSFKWLGDFAHDETYKKNDLTFSEDTNTFYSRRHLWQ